MASAARRLLFYSERCPRRISSNHTTPTHATQWARPLSSTAPQRARGERRDGPIPTAVPTKIIRKQAIPVNPEEETAAQLRKLVDDLKALDPEVVKDAIRKGEQGIPFAQDFNLERDEDFEIEADRGRLGFWAEGEESMGPDEDFHGDDLTSLGHGQLDQHRELRHYNRLISWELPLLHQLARPFEPPTAATPFRFRYTSYLGEKHPATNKVVVEFSPSDMPALTPLQKDKLIKLVGPRYNPDSDIVKMSCELYDTQPQNKRFLGDTISKLLAEAKDGTDTFADVPFDFRHHKPKVHFAFPQAWIMTAERKKYLEDKRAHTAKRDNERLNNGHLVDGKKIIDTSLPFMAAQPEPVMVGGPRGTLLR
ncbi:mitochondrial ribosomal subunit protein-domain-containing protein [Massariosphaeria phaeospora]|uniref:Mitochondrial ribosomal subunit protein-domain-containing protein n=1 Tax=Massariosphaeria phaeospora TaxID=100035 RepID=A0A7C8MC24_9PLEO|nr:mitochondrial ribosomal subunit protein-domain-containing protein [Massariosphaeria phaeospora]